ncbi:MAG: peptide chain release factor-like protein [Pirellulales bacterium]
MGPELPYQVVEATARTRWLEADPRQLVTQCQVTRTRGQGPGGQHRNKVSTAIVLIHEPTGLRAEAAERRSQHENLQVALDRLRREIALHCRAVVDAEHYQPTELWQSRCRQGKVSVSTDHRDFAALLAESLDLLAAHGWRPAPAAAQLGCSSSQLVKLVQQHPAAGTWVNRMRMDAGLEPLK